MRWLVVITAAAGIALLAVALAARRSDSAMDIRAQQTAAGAIPAIDAAAPAQFSTAAFAAG